MLLGSLLLNWVLGPALMFALAWIFLPDLPEYRTGSSSWASPAVAHGDHLERPCVRRPEAAAVLVAINSVFQVIMFAALGWFYLSVLPGWLGLEQTTIDTSPWQIAKSVLIFLGIPLLAGFLTRYFGEKSRGRAWYESTFLPRIGPWALYGLLFTIVILFALQGEQITSQPMDVVRIAIPLLAYFAIMWGGGYLLARSPGWATNAPPRSRSPRRATTSNSPSPWPSPPTAPPPSALAGVVGPLIEVPVLVGLVYVSLALRKRFARPAFAQASSKEA
ncbi:arsenical-resistance protein [Rhodococcus hoagii]|nr:arsenical-resistance protein [Prescottella equi]NKZ87725.1 arsenical-resistance protein [Prescottella equi]